MSALIEFFNRRSPLFILGLGTIFVGIMGFMDYLTGPELLSGLFYLLPVFIVAWFAGRWAGCVISVACAAVWLLNDAIISSFHALKPISYENVLMELFIFLVFTVALSALKNAVENEKTAIQNRIQHDLAVAQEVQAGMFPRYLPPMETLDYAGECRPAVGIAGDYYDFLPIGSGRLGIAIGDVAGKGLPAALLMASLQGILRSEATGRDQPIEMIISNLNRLLCASITAPRYATLFYGQYDDNSRVLTFVNAGHNPPLLLRCHSAADTAVPSATESHYYTTEHLTEGGTVLGVFADAPYQFGIVRLEPGDLLVLYTDGITEAANDRDEEFGEQRLVATLAGKSNLRAEELLGAVFHEVVRFVSGALPKDDMTLAIFRIR